MSRSFGGCGCFRIATVRHLILLMGRGTTNGGHIATVSVATADADEDDADLLLSQIDPRNLSPNTFSGSRGGDSELLHCPGRSSTARDPTARDRIRPSSAAILSQLSPRKRQNRSCKRRTGKRGHGHHTSPSQLLSGGISWKGKADLSGLHTVEHCRLRRHIASPPTG